VIVDSIQTMTSRDLTGAAGSVGQLRTAADRLTSVAKETQIPIFLVGHVTKDGTIAGPKVLEHIVDTVVEVSGERTGQLRLVRTIKNRFGPTDEVGVFRMREWGMQPVDNPSEIFLEQTADDVAGSATVCVMEGTRPLLIEVQALVNTSQLAMPRRVGRGIELSRIQVLAAVLQKHCSVPLGTQDIFLSAAGGMKLREPAVDLGLAMAVTSSYSNKPVPEKTVFIGEVGLQGEIRTVSHAEQRVKEAKRLGYKHVISRESHQQLREVLKELGLR
jgi:DNA repair protein RadA/Sms